MQPHTHINMTITKSLHARRRIAQRNICLDALALVSLYGADIPAGSGCVRRALRYGQITDLHEQGYAFALIEKALRLEAVFSDADELITCYMRTPKRACLGTRQSRRLGQTNRRNPRGQR